MSLGHVYIVLEPVGSARLTFGDDRYYEFMCFDVPKVVQSPGCDHGHDEEYRNGRDVKIDILDDYIRTSERFRVIRVFIGVPESYGNSPGSIWALLGFRRKREERLHAPQGLVRIGLGGGAAPPPSFPSPFPFLVSYSYYMEGLLVGLGKGESYSRWE